MFIGLADAPTKELTTQIRELSVFFEPQKSPFYLCVFCLFGMNTQFKLVLKIYPRKPPTYDQPKKWSAIELVNSDRQPLLASMLPKTLDRN